MNLVQNNNMRVRTLNDDTPIAKVVLVGNYRSGKSSVLLRFSDNIFQDSQMSTIGVEFKLKRLQLNNNRNISLQIWDTGGGERFQSIIHSYYRGAHGILMVYDITNRKSFQTIRSRLTQVKYNNNNPKLPIILFGNKCDKQQQRIISLQQAQQFANQNNMQYFQGSAKQNINIKQAFDFLGQQMMSNMTPQPIIQPRVLKPSSVHYQSFQMGQCSKRKSYSNIRCIKTLTPLFILVFFVLLSLIVPI